MHEIVNMLKTNLKIRSYNAAVHGALLSVMACHCFEIPSVSTFFCLASRLVGLAVQY